MVERVLTAFYPKITCHYRMLICRTLAVTFERRLQLPESAFVTSSSTCSNFRSHYQHEQLCSERYQWSLYIFPERAATTHKFVPFLLIQFFDPINVTNIHARGSLRVFRKPHNFGKRCARFAPHRINNF